MRMETILRGEGIMRTLTEEEYVKLGGGKCPFCRSNQIDGGFVNIEAGDAYQDITCIECNRVWTDHYILVGYQER